MAKTKKIPKSDENWTVYRRTEDGRYVDENGQEVDLERVLQEAAHRERD